MKKAKKLLAIVTALVLSISLLVTSASAETVLVAGSTHSYTTIQPCHFRLSSAVSYSQLYGNKMTITNMTSLIINYEGATLQCPYFKVENATRYNYTKGIYNNTTIPAGTSCSTTINWSNFLNTYYPNDKSTTYNIGKTTSDSTNLLYTELGVWTGSFYDYSSLAFQHVAYWFGNGYIKIEDSVCDNAPYWTSKTVNTVKSSSNSALETYSVESASVAKSDTATSLAIKTNIRDSEGITTLPVIATDSNFDNCIDTDAIQVELDEDGTFYVNIEDDIDTAALYVKMPFIVSVLDAEDRYITDSSLFSVEESDDEETDVTTLTLTYDCEDIDEIPNSATLQIGDNIIESFSSQVLWDSNTGEATSGILFFGVSGDNTLNLNANYSLTLHDSIVAAEGPSIKIDVA